LENRPLHQNGKEGRSRMQHLQNVVSPGAFRRKVHNWLKESMPNMEMGADEINEQVSTSFFCKINFFQADFIQPPTKRIKSGLLDT
jgi:hypothetical protein